MPSTTGPATSADELRLQSNEESNTMSFIRYVMCLAACLPIAFLSKSPVFKAIAFLCAITTFYSFPVTPKTVQLAQVICALSLVLSARLYYINGGIPQDEDDKDILFLSKTLSLFLYLGRLFC